ncbi:serine/threonine-protein kinase RIO1 [Apiospora arundinis]
MIQSRRSRTATLLLAIFLTASFYTAARVGILGPSYIRSPFPLSSYRHYGPAADANTTEPENVVPPTQSQSQDPACAWMPDTSNILVVMKTGASEAFAKVPTQLMTTLRCVPDYLIFSDMKQTIAGVEIHDSLDTVLEEARKDNTDFVLYNYQQACEVDLENCNKEGGDAARAGWNLDKYKNIHIAEKTYRLRPNYDWYVFVDADTYVLWPNLVQWLSKFRASAKHYFGSMTMISEFPFAHGGSGYVISKAAMRQFGGRPDESIANKWDNLIHESCCGDYMFAKAFKEATDVTVKNVWPTINGEKPHTLPFGPSHWCQPVVTMHHMNAEEVSSFWEYERDYFKKKPQSLTTQRTLLLKDIYAHFLAPKMRASREDWDNLSDDVFYLDRTAKKHEDWVLERTKKGPMSQVERKAHKSYEDCRAMCESVQDCFQFLYHDGVCAASVSFKLGRPNRSEQIPSKRYRSGWIVPKINKWIERQGECKRPKWPEVK